MKKHIQLIASTAIIVVVCTFFIAQSALGTSIDALTFESPIQAIEQSFADNLKACVSSVENLFGTSNTLDWNCKDSYFYTLNLNNNIANTHITSFHTDGLDIYQHIQGARYTEKISINTIIAYGAKSFENNESEWFSSSNDLLPAPVPEPSTILLFGIGLIGIEEFRRKLIKLRKN